MNISQIKEAVRAAYQVRQPLMLWGPPGVGKSSAYRQAAEEEKLELIDLRVSIREPVDLCGFPQIEKGVTRWSRPGFLPTAGKGILVLDELVQATPMMQAACSQLLLDRKIGDYTLPDGWAVMAAGNRASDRAATNAMPTHVANRLVHLNAEVHNETWIQWALKAGIDIRVIAFIKWRAKLLHSFDPQAKVLAFPSPRSWEFVSKLLASTKSTALLGEFVRGAVGEGAASEFMPFLQIIDKLPSIDAIMMNPQTAPIPSEMAVLYTVVTTLASKASVDNIGKIVTYFNRLTDEANRPEFSILAIKEVTAKDTGKAKICNTRPFIEWASKHSHMLA